MVSDSPFIKEDISRILRREVNFTMRRIVQQGIVVVVYPRTDDDAVSFELDDIKSGGR